ISRGDYHTLMKRMTDELEAAAHHVANRNQKDMIDRYVSSFSRGSVPDHEDASRYWIKDKGPVVETYIGFIESYRDPFGLRGEYEGIGVFTDLRGKAFEVQVGLHELLGHGSGKLFSKDKNGVFNFEQDKVINPLTGDKIRSWYNPGETWDTQFSTIASTYEECRAECVGIYLSTDRNILRIFGYEGAEAEDIMYVNWLSMLRAGLIALEFYTPETKKWRQAHMQAPDVSSGQLLYNKYSTVTDDHLMLRDIVMARKMPRRLFVQPHTSIDTDGSVVLNEFDSSFEGIISSFLARYPNYDTELESLWRNDQHYWKQK
uniref:Dipeptidyl peptidase III n=1 Tax=Amphimedon queenslandica TaxID=400682 RepID=A0A1X7UQ62_AMPQE